ncbi:hypothetical protein RJZ90_006177, partial [Blastomyces dermatitidis]
GGRSTAFGQWSEFTYAHIMQLYGTLLQQVQIENEPMPNSPPQPINTEPMFAHLAPQLANLHLTPITVDIGDLKVSWKWGSDWAAAESQIDRTEYLQVLSQINFYMKQHNARYGFALTDTELVPIKRLDANGNLLVARAIPWEAGGPGRLTVLMGLWYLGMLGAVDDDWQLL